MTTKLAFVSMPNPLTGTPAMCEGFAVSAKWADWFGYKVPGGWVCLVEIGHLDEGGNRDEDAPERVWIMGADTVSALLDMSDYHEENRLHCGDFDYCPECGNLVEYRGHRPDCSLKEGA